MQYKSSVVCAQCAATRTPDERLVRGCVSIKAAARSGSKFVMQHCVKQQPHSKSQTLIYGGTYRDDALQHVNCFVNGSISSQAAVRVAARCGSKFVMQHCVEQQPHSKSQTLIHGGTHRDDALQHVERLVNGSVSIKAAA